MEIENGIKMIINEKEEGFYPCSDILGMINILEKKALNIREINLQLIKVQYCYKDKIIFHNKEVNEMSEKLVSAVKPTMTIILGFIVGWMGISMMGPIYANIGSISDFTSKSKSY